MKFLVGAACAAIIAASGVYLTGQYQAHAERKAATELAATQLCLQKRAEAANYKNSMAWTMASVTYKTGDEYCR